MRVSDRDGLRRHLADAGIATVVNYPRALPFYPAYAYRGHVPGDFPVAHRHQSEIVSLPIYPEMTDEAIDYVADAVAAFATRADARRGR